MSIFSRLYRVFNPNDADILLERAIENNKIRGSLSPLNELLCNALSIKGGYDAPGGVLMRLAPAKMNLLTSAMLNVLNNEVLPPAFQKDFRFTWIDHQGLIRLSLLYYGDSAPGKDPVVVPGKYILGEMAKRGFNVRLYKQCIDLLKEKAEFLYLGAAQHEKDPGELPILTFKGSRIDSIRPYVRTRLAKNFAYKHIYDHVSYVGKTDKMFTNALRVLVYTPLVFVPILGWMLIYAIEKFNSMNIISQSFGPDNRQLVAAKKFSDQYENLSEEERRKYENFIARPDYSAATKEDMINITQKIRGMQAKKGLAVRDVQNHISQSAAGKPLARRDFHHHEHTEEEAIGPKNPMTKNSLTQKNNNNQAFLNNKNSRAFAMPEDSIMVGKSQIETSSSAKKNQKRRTNG